MVLLGVGSDMQRVMGKCKSEEVRRVYGALEPEPYFCLAHFIRRPRGRAGQASTHEEL